MNNNNANNNDNGFFHNLDSSDVVNLTNIVGGEARTEHVLQMSGSACRYTGKPFSKYMNMKIVDKKTGEFVEVNAEDPASPYAYKYFFSLQEKPVFWEQIEALDPDVRATKGLYMIKYTPRNSKDRKKGRPWKIGQDLIRWDIRVSGTVHWHTLCKKIPELGWLERNSTLSDEMFRIAAMHPGMSFWFSVDWVAYEAKLQAQRNTKELIEQPFVSRKASVEEYKQIKSAQNKTLTLRYFGDVLKEINEAERDPSVQEEMLSTSGEVYVRGRNTLRDPVTGRLLKHKEKEEE